VGREGRGESVWLGFVLYDILRRFIPICDQREDRPRGERYRQYLESLGRALNADGWDGQWYRRAYYDNGAPIGSAASDECRIDAIAQAWAVLSGAAPVERAELALDALEDQLVDEGAGIIRLLTPAFDRTPHDPGYIKGYLPGVRENGGQYTHGALWAVRALAEAGRAERAAHLLDMLSPVSHARSAEAVAVYQAEPYVIAADVYGVAPHLGRGGWTWYTGSAGWMFRVALESVLGLTLEDGRTLRLVPCIPDDWPGFSIRYRFPGEGTVYQIAVEQPPREAAEATRAELDGEPLGLEESALRIPVFRDGALHQVKVRLGRDLRPRYAPSTVPLDRMTSR
jgi:cyclic beta-1,2-glucan synthetase